MASSGENEHLDLDSSAEILLTGTRQQKLQDAMERSEKTEYSVIPTFSGDITESINIVKFAAESMDVSFDHDLDFLPGRRRKYIHSMGSVAPVKYVSLDKVNGYTGLFKGGDSCIARLSLAANPSKSPFTPGMALKCFRDGAIPSGNFITMYSLTGQPESTNFFAHEFSNIVKPAESGALKLIQDTVFKRASKCPFWISLHQFSSITQLGEKEASPNWPQQIFLVPAEVSFPNSTNLDFRAQLATISSGKKLWDVYALKSHNDIKSSRVKIGEIVTAGKFRSSSWGDKQLFFQHERGEVDHCNA